MKNSTLKEVGAIWLKNDKAGNTMLSFAIAGTQYLGFKVTEKKNEKQPDYRISAKTADGNLKDCGGAWKGVTAKGNQKLNMKIEVAEGKVVYFLAVEKLAAPGKELSDKAPQMEIYETTVAEAAEAAEVAESPEAVVPAEVVKTKPTL